MKPPIPPDLAWRGFFGPEPWWGGRRSPESMRRWAIALFLVSLTSLFIASLVGYAWTRLYGPGADQAVELPAGLWLSTAVLLLCGLTIWLAQRAANAGSIPRLRVWIVAAWLLSITFLAIQTPSVLQLVESHQAGLAERSTRAEGLVFTLIVLHALHVVGGLVPLTGLVADLLRGRLGPERFGSVRSCAAYWHFLEGVWVVMFSTLLVLG